MSYRREVRAGLASHDRKLDVRTDSWVSTRVYDDEGLYVVVEVDDVEVVRVRVNQAGEVVELGALVAGRARDFLKAGGV
jgi:hypothetical protein